MANIVSLEEAHSIPEIYTGKRVVVGGCFDLLHIGHTTFLENAKKQGDTLIVWLESDTAIKQKKGMNRPIHNQYQRAKMLSSLRAVDVVVLLKDSMENADYTRLLQIIKPVIIATTEHDPYMKQREQQAKQIGAKVVAVNKYIPEVSTTKLLTILSEL